jgi:S-adenosylmethionine/arginine decarboxylase-like enzyme
LINAMLQDIDMKRMGATQNFNVRDADPEKNGSSWLVAIQTSHVALHFWTHPDPHIMHVNGKCLLQFDLYTCNRLSKSQIQRVLELLGEFEPTHANITLINRQRGMDIEQQREWQMGNQGTWDDFAQSWTLRNPDRPRRT